MPVPQPSNSGVPGFSSPSPQFAEPRLPNLSPTRLRPPGVSPTSAIVPYKKPPLPVRVPKGGRLPVGRFPARIRVPKLPGRVLGRVAGPLAALLLAADIMEQLAPGFHRWLERQWGPGSGRKHLGDPLHSGGQCNAMYAATGHLSVPVGKTSGTATWTSGPSTTQTQGPVTYGASRIYFANPPNDWWTELELINAAGEVWFVLRAYCYNCQAEITADFFRTDGGPDNCGDPPRQPISYPIVRTAPRELEQPRQRRPPSDSPIFVPILSPSPGGRQEPGGRPILGPPISLWPPGGDNPYAPPWDPATGFPSDDPGTGENPRKRKLPAPGPAPIVPPSPPPPPRRPPDDSCQDPCWEFGFDFLERIWDALEQQKEPRGDECPELFDLYLPYTVCTEQGPEVRNAYIQAAFWQPSNIRDLFANSAALAAKACNEPEAIASIPEWWQVRLGAERPQLVLIFRRTGTRGYNQLAIPHPLVTEPPSEPPISAYTKGNWQGMITLRDNSKFIVYAATAGEAERVVNQARSLIRGDFLGSPPLISISEKKGYPLDNDLMVPTSAKYHPDGQRNLKPKWRVSFTDRL